MQLSFFIYKIKSNPIIILYAISKEIANGCTIVISHGNKTSLGVIYPFLYDFATQLNCNVISYDYTGYGRSDGTASEEEMKSDITEIGLFLQEQKIPNEEVILMGHSIGSVPSVYFASNNHDILGMILMSPISSGKKLFFRQKTNSKTITRKSNNKDSEVGNYIEEDDDEDCNDKTKDKIMFHNINKLTKIASPVFLIHGMQDEVIPYTHSKDIAKRVVAVSQWFPKKGNHINIIYEYREKFLSKIRDFVSYCDKVRVVKIAQKSKSDLYESTNRNVKGKDKEYFTLGAHDSNEYTDNFASQIGDSNSIDVLSNVSI